MDPLSVTLAVITLATAVKDMVELGQKIHESFAKVSNNLRNAQRVAEDIKEMVEEIRVFCEDHKDALSGVKELRLALQSLLACVPSSRLQLRASSKWSSKFRSFETSILPLLPRTGGRRRDRLIRGWDAWRNNNKIEGSILDLQSDILKVIRRHMMKSAMRTEIKLETIHQETSRGITDVHQDVTQGLEVLEAVRRDVSAIRTTTTATTMIHRSYNSGEEFNRNVIMFAKSTPSTSAPMLRTPDVITEELMTTAYIKLQVNNIIMTLEIIPTLRESVLSRESVPLFQISSTCKEMSMSVMHLRHHVVRQVIGIRDVLSSEHIISIDQGDAKALNELSIGLEALGMGHESLLVGQRAIMLVRWLIDASGGGQPYFAASLALYLFNQSVKDYRSGNKAQSLQAIKEAYTITQNLRNQYKGEAEFRKLYSDILLQYAATLVDNKRSITLCIEAVQALEDILDVQAYTWSNLPEQIQNIADPSSSFVDNLFSLAPPTITIKSYAAALYRLGTYLAIDGHSEIALDLQLLAIALLRKMVSIHGHEYNVGLAWALSRVVRGGNEHRIPAEELIDMADECILLLRELAEKNPLYYARELVDVLWTKTSTLRSLDRDVEAISIWEEVVSLAGQIVQDSELCADALSNLSDWFRRLKRHNDAVRTGRLAITTYRGKPEIRAMRYFNLSLDLRQLGRYKESAEAARISVTLCRQLAIRDPATWMGDLTRGLSDLAHCLAASGDYSEALVAWKESTSILDCFLDTKPTSTVTSSSYVIDRYLSALIIHRFISFSLEGEDERLKVNFKAIQYLRRLSEIYPQNTNIIGTMFQAEYWHTYNMLRIGHLQDAEQYIDHWLDVWRTNSEAISEPLVAASHAGMVILKADALDAQGCTKEALLTTRKVPEIVRLSVTTNQFSFSQMVDSMVEEARLQVNLGNSKEALQVAEEALQLSRDNKPEPFVYDLVWSLHTVAFTALSCRNYERTIEAAREGCNLSTGPNWQGTYDDIFIRPSLFAIWSSAEANLGRCSNALEYAHRAVNESLDIKDRKADIPAMTAEHSYMETRGNLAEILLATGDIAQARQICEERSAYFFKRVEKRMGEYRELAPVLRMLGVLCCSEGRHEEGNAAAKELTRIMNTLGSVFPSLQEQVKIRLRSQAKIPILRVLEDMCQKLNCGHQTEIVSLFAI